MVEVKVHPFDLTSDDIDSFKELFYEQSKKASQSNKQYKEPRVPVDALFKRLKATIMQSDQQWSRITKMLDVKEADNNITFNEFLRLLEQESYFRDIMFEYQLFYKSTKRLRFSREIHLTNRRQGQYGDKAVKGIPNSLQAAHLIDHIVFFESNGIQLLICGFENKDVHAIDYASGDIVFEFIFKDELIPSILSMEGEAIHSQFQQQHSIMKKQQTFFKLDANSKAQNVMRYQFKQSLHKSGVTSPEDLITLKPAKKEILGSIKTNIAKKLVDTVEDTLANDFARPNSPPNKGEGSPMKNQKFALTAPSSPSRKKRQAVSSTSQQRQRYFGILGLDPIREEENKPGGYKTVLSAQPSNKGGKVVLKREYTYGLDERLFTSEFEREKIKAKFGNFMKLVDLDIKMNEKYAGDLRAHKQKINAISSLFGNKKPVSSEEQISNNAAIELESAIDKIIKQQSQRKHDEERYQGQLSYFNMVDNEETQKLLKTLDKLSAKSQVVQGKAKRLNNLNERGSRHIQVLKDAEHGTKHHTGKKEPSTEHFTNKISEMLNQSYVAQTQTAAALKAAAATIPVSNAQFDSVEVKSSAKNTVVQDGDKVSYPICIQHFKPLDLIAFALVNRQLQIYTIRQTVAKLLFEKRATIKTEQMAVCMSVEQHKVTDRLLCCVGFQYDLIEVHEFNQNKDYSHKVLLSMLSPYSQVTNTLYIRELGLVVTTYTGYMEIFENCDFRSIWSNIGEMHEGRGRGPMSLTLLDFSEEMDMIAYAGGQGKLGALDATSKQKIGVVQAHSDEIVSIGFYDQQLQIITVSLTCQVALWDAQKLECIQLIRDQKQAVLHNTLSSAFFYKPEGKLVLGTTKMNEWKLNVDADVQIEVQKADVIAEDYIKDLILKLKTQRRVGRVVFENNLANIEKQTVGRQRSLAIARDLKELQKHGYIPDERYGFLKGFLRQSIDQKVAAYSSVDKNDSVLPSPLTRMVNMFIDEAQQNILTIDSDALVRVWSMDTGDCTGSYPIELRKDEFTDKKKLTGCTVDKDFKYIVVAYESGIVQVNNLHSGQIIFNEPENMMVLDTEVSDLRFFPDNCNFWFVAACWEGKVSFFSESQLARGRTFVKFQQAKGTHAKDVISLDVNEENLLATASIDNVVSFWNTYVATESKHFRLPRSLVQTESNQNIQSIRFLKGHLHCRNLLIIMNSGDIYILDCVKMVLLNYEDGCAVQGSATDYPAVDFKDSRLVTVGESGLGRLLKVEPNPVIGEKRKFLITPYEEDFRVMPSGQLRADPKCVVIRVKFSKRRDLFIVAQLNGRVQLYTFDDERVTLIGRLNSDLWPTTKEERRLVEKEEKKKQMLMRRISKAFSTPASNQQAKLQSQMTQNFAKQESMQFIQQDIIGAVFGTATQSIEIKQLSKARIITKKDSTVFPATPKGAKEEDSSPKFKKNNALSKALASMPLSPAARILKDEPCINKQVDLLRDAWQEQLDQTKRLRAINTNQEPLKQKFELIHWKMDAYQRRQNTLQKEDEAKLKEEREKQEADRLHTKRVEDYGAGVCKLLENYLEGKSDRKRLPSIGKNGDPVGLRLNDKGPGVGRPVREKKPDNWYVGHSHALKQEEENPE